jgi:hypothetical protein
MSLSLLSPRDGHPVPLSQNLVRCLRVTVAALAFACPVVAGAMASPNKAYVARTGVVDIAIVGDSLANDLGRGMEDLFRGKRNIKVIKETRYSTGLTRTDYFNWNAELREFVRKTNPDAIVVLIGGNDAQSIRVKGRSLERFSKPWLREYERRVALFMRILRQEKAKIYWVGLPVVRSDSMSRYYRTMNLIYRRQAARHDIKFISIWKEFADSNGEYTSFGRNVRGVKRRLRKNDGMHFTTDGALRLASSVARAIGVR